MRKQRGQGAASKHAITDNQTGEHASSFTGEMQPSVGSIRKAEQHAEKA